MRSSGNPNPGHCMVIINPGQRAGLSACLAGIAPQFGRTRRGWDTFKGGRRLVQPAGMPVDRSRWTQTRSARWLLRVLRFESKRSQLLTHERPFFHFGERFPASLQLSQVNEIGPDEVGGYPIVLAL